MTKLVYICTIHMSSEEFHISKQVLDRFCVAGINYHKADTSTRGLFSVSRDDFATIAATAKTAGIRSVFVVSTCNRTEIYGFAESVMQLVDLLCEQCPAERKTFLQYAFLKNGNEALQHLFRVSSGLDSQILGDYEVLGQIKKAVDLAKVHEVIGPVMDRVLNFVFQASKRIKTETGLSNGTVSVSFAAIELLQAVEGIKTKSILVIGAGKFGSNVCKNMAHYFPEVPITIMNRTDETALVLSQTSGIHFAAYKDRAMAIAKADVVIVCTNASEPTVLPEYFVETGDKLILDLSVPVNVHPAVKQMAGKRVIDVDEISSTILDKTLANRRAEVPKAEAIIENYTKEFWQWLKDYRFALHLKTWKNKLEELDKLSLHECEFARDARLKVHAVKAQKAVKQLAVNLKTKNDKGCQFINLINDYLQPGNAI
ncbi:MAG TPA: glutamyl-tRNA reductase [Niabella sp.]|nr:glutamyl-tRNA reductase [Niabella sp.]HRB28494.1 glutamyl-tRNA reductase [Niabella sp.]HRB36189.1 glutamyl-tRNA reductase [Niabella sp.]